MRVPWQKRLLFSLPFSVLRSKHVRGEIPFSETREGRKQEGREKCHLRMCSPLQHKHPARLETGMLCPWGSDTSHTPCDVHGAYVNCQQEMLFNICILSLSLLCWNTNSLCKGSLYEPHFLFPKESSSQKLTCISLRREFTQNENYAGIGYRTKSKRETQRKHV